MISDLKTCAKCGVAKPATPQNYYRDKCKRDGLMSYCIPCSKQLDAARPKSNQIRCKQWYVVNRDRKRAISLAAKHNRRAAILARDGNKCVYCGSTDKLQIDHIVPKSRGGTNDISNLATACWKCNRSKSDKTLAEWKPQEQNG